MAIPDTEGPPRSRQEAKSTGSPFYVSSRPCKNGHLSPRRTSNGNCTECECLPEKRAASVRASMAWLDAKPENRAKHNVRNKERQKRLREKDLEAARERERIKRQNMTPEQKAQRSLIMRAWRDEKAEHVRAYDSAYRKLQRQKHPERERLKGRAARLRRRGVIEGAEGSGLTTTQIAEMLVYQGGICSIPGCGGEIWEEFEIDHKVPVSRGGSNLPDNLHLTCEPCNRQKNKLTVEEFVAKRMRRRSA